MLLILEDEVNNTNNSSKGFTFEMKGLEFIYSASKKKENTDDCYESFFNFVVPDIKLCQLDDSKEKILIECIFSKDHSKNNLFSIKVEWEYQLVKDNSQTDSSPLKTSLIPKSISSPHLSSLSHSLFQYYLKSMNLSIQMIGMQLHYDTNRWFQLYKIFSR